MDGKDPEEMMKIGVDYAVMQCLELLNSGVAGLHFYTLNRNQSTERVLGAIGDDFF
jgi:methylenetetrahydrofolate reductase (NADPH)